MFEIISSARPLAESKQIPLPGVIIGDLVVPVSIYIHIYMHEPEDHRDDFHTGKLVSQLLPFYSNISFPCKFICFILIVRLLRNSLLNSNRPLSVFWKIIYFTRCSLNFTSSIPDFNIDQIFIPKCNLIPSFYS